MQWQCLRFDELTTHQLYMVMKLRVDIFVVEQNCPYHELDNKDLQNDVYHLLGYDGDTLIAYLRLLAPKISYPNVSLGRVVIAEVARGSGIAHQLLAKGVQLAEQYWPNHSIDIGAQSHLQSLYQAHGFKAFSEEYLEDGIPHVDMRLPKGITLD